MESFVAQFFLRFLISFLNWVLSLWWFWVFIFLAVVARRLWLLYVQEYYRRNAFKWVLLEVRIPREIVRTPRAMEQVFMAMHAVRNTADDLREVYWDGEVTMWFCCEAISFGGEIHFYLRVPGPRKNHIEAALFSQYPDIEITEVQDYIDRLPKTVSEIFASGYRIFGNELILDKPAFYPITTFVDFEAVQEEKELDPVSNLIETLSRIGPNDHLWLQILLRPKAGKNIKKFVDETDKEVERLKEKTGKRQIFSPQFGQMIMIDRAPGEVELLKAVDRKADKPAFDVVIRYLYIAPKETFTASFGRRNILSSLNQYASEWLNRFRHNTSAWTIAKLWAFPYLFPGTRARARAERLYRYYRRRRMYALDWMTALFDIRLFDWGFRPRRFSNVVLNVEELATLFHPPTAAVLTGPLIKRVEARKIGPPAGLPIYGEGEDAGEFFVNSLKK